MFTKLKGKKRWLAILALAGASVLQSLGYADFAALVADATNLILSNG